MQNEYETTDMRKNNAQRPELWFRVSQLLRAQIDSDFILKFKRYLLDIGV